MPINNHINYIELKSKNISQTKTFYTNTFGWSFTDYSTHYTAFNNSGLQGGFEKTDGDIKKGVLIVLYHNNLDMIQEKIKKNGGKISVPTFSFPGGQRFHFLDPCGNELAIWSE